MGIDAAADEQRETRAIAERRRKEASFNGTPRRRCRRRLDAIVSRVPLNPKLSDPTKREIAALDLRGLIEI